MTDRKGQREQPGDVELAIPEQGVQIPDCVSTEEESYPALAPVVCRYFKQTTRLRYWCLKITHSQWLDYVSILMILLSCATLGMYKPYEEKTPSLKVLDAFIFAFFVVEMLIKMVALGVFGYDRSYLSNNWSKFDVFINFGQSLDYFLASLGVHLEICETLGPMRLISRVKSMQDLVTVFFTTVPMLANALILYFLIIYVFSVMGVQLWAGLLRNRCFLGEDIPTKYNVSLSSYFMPERPFICSPDNENGMLHCHDVPPYSEDGKTCSLVAPHHVPAGSELVPTVPGASVNTCINWNMYYNICRAGDVNPHMGTISFDNIGFAWIAMFQVATLEGWSEIMFHVMDAHSFWNCAFFILVTIMGSFIMLNVCAVVIATQFSENMLMDPGEQSAITVFIRWIYHKFTCWLQGISSRFDRHRNRVHPRHRKNTSLKSSWMLLKRKLKKIVQSKLFDRVIMFTVVLSILTMAVEHHGQPKELGRILQISYIVFTFIFFVEMMLKLLVHARKYFWDVNNIFDFAIVIVSLWEITAKGDGRVSALRALRLLRFVRLVHFLPYLKRQLLVLKRTVKEAAGLCKLMLFSILIFSVLGMQLFAGKFSFTTQDGDTITDRKNFDTLLSSMVTVFQILTLEDWNLVLYNAIAATSPWAALYFVVLIMFGKHVLLNILVGIVVQSFQERRSSSSDTDSSLSSHDATSLTPSDTNEENGPSRPEQDSTPEEEPTPADTSEDNRSLNVIQRVLRWCKEREDWALYMLSPQNRLRVCCQRVISHKWFDHTILLFILLNCVTIAIERPGIDPKSTERWILTMSLYVFSAIFLVEMLLKVLALGLLFGTESYCQSLWNVMDGSLVILSVVHIVVSLANSLSGANSMLGILKILRLLRTLRALRVIKRAPKLKLAVEALMASVKPIGNIVIICCAFFFFYGILGVQLFKGGFYHCLGQDTRNITNKSDCLSADYRWVPKTYNFDNLPQALMALFVMYSTDGWVNIMYDGLDAVGVDKQPVRNHNEWMLLYFISFMIMSFVLLDMFIGVMVETFHQCQQEQKQRREGLLEEGGEELQDQHSEPEQVPYYINYSPIRQSIHTLCTSNFLDISMTIVVFISVLMMAFEHYQQPQYVVQLTEYSQYVFTAILIIEVLLKLVAFGVLRFIKVSYNLLDIAIVLVSVIGIVSNEMKMAEAIPINPSILRVCRVLRLAQVLKAKKIRVLLKTVTKTLSQVGNICLLFVFFFFIYAALGVELFGKLECTDDLPCLGLHRHTNFKHFGMALLTLYRVCTGDGWSEIMKDTLRKCRPGGGGGCQSYLSWVSPLYFITFVVLAQFVLVNLVIAAIMQALEDSREEEKVQDAERAPPSQGERVGLSCSHIDAEGPSEQSHTHT